MQRFFKYPDYFFLSSLLLLIAAGFLAIYSASYSLNIENFMFKHGIFFVSGMVVFVFISSMPKHFIKDFAPLLYLINLAILFLLNVFQWLHILEKPARWIEIGGITFQPSEFMKITLILFLAWIFSQKQWSSFQKYIVSSLATALPVVLILLQPDMGTAAILIAILLLMTFFSCLGFPYLSLSLILGSLSILPLKRFFLHEYQLNRLLTFLHPTGDPMGEGWSINQALIAVGSGGLKGKGFLLGTQSKMGFLPNTQYSDFIFAVIAEEWGFIGSMFLLFLFLLFFTSCFLILFKTTDNFMKLLVLGVVAYWFIQLLVNISMNLGLMPVTGLPLPFISYGGTAQLANIAAAGMIYHIHLHQKTVSY
jgi:rod shape determining protein RodA